MHLVGREEQRESSCYVVLHMTQRVRPGDSKS